MSTKALGVVGRGLGRHKLGIELGSGDFYTNSIPNGDVPNFCHLEFTNTNVEKLD